MCVSNSARSSRCNQSASADRIVSARTAASSAASAASESAVDTGVPVREGTCGLLCGDRRDSAAAQRRGIRLY